METIQKQKMDSNRLDLSLKLDQRMERSTFLIEVDALQLD